LDVRSHALDRGNKSVLRRRDLLLEGLELWLGSRVLVTIERDGEYPELWRVRLADGHLTDMVNLSRAKDAAVCLAVSALNSVEAEAA
jgi:hypothetical protein